MYHLENLSFREYLSLEDLEQFEPFTLEELLKNHLNLAADINNKLEEKIKDLNKSKIYRTLL